MFCSRGHNQLVRVCSRRWMISVIYDVRQCAIALALDWVHGHIQITQSSIHCWQLECTHR